MDIPLQQDMYDLPEEDQLAWLMVAFPIMGGNMSNITRPSDMFLQSRHLYAAGVRFHPELQTIQFCPNPASDNWFAASAGSWIPIEEELPAEVTAPDTSHLTTEEKRILLERLTEEFKKDEVRTDYAEVVQ